LAPAKRCAKVSTSSIPGQQADYDAYLVEVRSQLTEAHRSCLNAGCAMTFEQAIVSRRPVMTATSIHAIPVFLVEMLSKIAWLLWQLYAGITPTTPSDLR
jgi:hypothetical protein